MYKLHNGGEMKHRVTFIVVFLLMLYLVSCSSEPEIVRETVIAEVPVTVEVTREVTVPVEQTVEVTTIVEVTRIVEIEKIITATPTKTPTNTPTPETPPTNTPASVATATPTTAAATATPAPPTATPVLPTDTPVPAVETPTPTPEPTGPDSALTESRGSGFYRVGSAIAPGKWRSTGTGGSCYWARLDQNQDLLDNHYGMAGGTVSIRPDDYEVELSSCGTWIYVENEVPTLQADASADKGSGFYTVGVEIVPGSWRSTGSGDSCYWARLDGNQNLLDNHYGLSGGTITIQPGDYEVEFSDCGTFVLEG
jgi:hypothetical protein